jgi:hypothetical protein
LAFTLGGEVLEDILMWNSAGPNAPLSANLEGIIPTVGMEFKFTMLSKIASTHMMVESIIYFNLLASHRSDSYRASHL